jgi:hypothetical protein
MEDIMGKKEKTVKRWAVRSVNLDDMPSLQETLDQGFEPFALMTRFMPSKVIDPKSGGNAVIPVNLIFFKQSYMIEVDEQGKEKNVVTLFKREKAPDETEPKPA